MSTSGVRKVFFEKFQELYELYSNVKQKIILAEETGEKFPLTLTNEVRNSYDHVFRIFANGNAVDESELNKQFVSAGRHLKRAGYDACEFIAGEYVKRINKILHPYPLNVLYSVLGEDYTKLKLFVNNVHSKYLVEARSKKSSKIEIEEDSEIDTIFPEFESIIEEVFNWWEFTIEKEGFLIAYVEEQKTNKRKDILVKIVIGLICGAITFIVTKHFFT